MTMRSNGEGQKVGVAEHAKSFTEHGNEIDKIIKGAHGRDLTDDEISKIKEYNDDIKKRANEIDRALK
ncbi:hypothetical protein ABV792_RS20450 [Escherichia coli]|uniref:hypothetical protein n=1 Tax=Escherichia coli TaxID=562 RepID=UPI0015822FD3|nr:hypothetical protein [Escherichia coli]EJD4605997.1 hypothetical protein [Escherichia coli]MCH4655042.1 hypothetical protein [Escherichia coli]MCI4527702.1 hypothetical protein [Escherichia coli]MDN0724593.1 hypothetical protein [Escherichia coli]MDN0771705.1 hypothetical protein [Escherichia coli]